MEDLRESRAYKFLKTLKRTEREHYRAFLASPFFNRDLKLVTCFDLFCEKLLDRSAGQLSPRDVFSFVYPEISDYQPYRITRLTSGLVEMFEKFVAFQARKNIGFFGELAECQAFHERGLDMERDKRLTQLAFTLETDKDSHSHYHAFRLAEYRLKNTTYLKRVRSSDALQAAYTSLDTFQRIQKLRLLCAEINRASIAHGPTPEWVKHEMGLLNTAPCAHDPLLELYHKNLQLLLHGHEQDFQDMLAAIDRHQDHYQRELMLEFYQQALNYRIGAFNKDQGDLDQGRKLLALYEKMLAKGVLLREGRISAWNYKNIVSLQARLGEFDALDAFTHTYHEKILENDAPGCARSFAKGLLAFYKGNLRDVPGSSQEDEAKGALRWMGELLAQSSNNVFWELEARAYLLLIKFELDDYEDETANEDSLRMFIVRNKERKLLSEDRYTAYSNFIKMLRQLYHAVQSSPDKSRTKLEKLRNKIVAMEFLAQKQWFIDKIASYLQSKN